ncbi:MAG: hypothetical protein HYY18_14685 [Planctomycetes bacterium]|nr:hypothetical protein [Planctomycetota bacterium]
MMKMLGVVFAPGGGPDAKKPKEDDVIVPGGDPLGFAAAGAAIVPGVLVSAQGAVTGKGLQLLPSWPQIPSGEIQPSTISRSAGISVGAGYDPDARILRGLDSGQAHINLQPGALARSEPSLHANFAMSDSLPAAGVNFFFPFPPPPFEWRRIRRKILERKTAALRDKYGAVCDLIAELDSEDPAARAAAQTELLRIAQRDYAFYQQAVAFCTAGAAGGGTSAGAAAALAWIKFRMENMTKIMLAKTALLGYGEWVDSLTGDLEAGPRPWTPEEILVGKVKAEDLDAALEELENLPPESWLGRDETLELIKAARQDVQQLIAIKKDQGTREAFRRQFEQIARRLGFILAMIHAQTCDLTD